MTFRFDPRATYGSNARFDGKASALTEDQLRHLAPSVFAVTAHESRSERFRPIPTIEVIRGLAKEGFAVVGARQSSTRDATKADFTKHLLRLRKLDGNNVVQVGHTCHEILLQNGNDGTSAYQLFSGLFRVVCQNSLVNVDKELDTLKVRHSGDVTAKVIEGTYRVLETAERALAAPQAWGGLIAGRDAKLALAEAAHALRFADDEGNVTTPIQPVQLLAPRRQADTASDLWTAFNVVQENALRGGLEGERVDQEGRRRRVTTRRINGIDQDVKLNRALWILGERMAEILGARAA